MNPLKRLGRFVLGHQRLVFRYPWQVASRTDTYSDTDWAGCVKTRKSTSGCCTLLDVPEADHAGLKAGSITPQFDGEAGVPAVEVSGARKALVAEFATG